MKSKKRDKDYDPQMELFPIIDIEEIKAKASPKHSPNREEIISKKFSQNTGFAKQQDSSSHTVNFGGIQDTSSETGSFAKQQDSTSHTDNLGVIQDTSSETGSFAKFQESSSQTDNLGGIQKKLSQEDELVSDNFHEDFTFEGIDFSEKDVVDHEFENCSFIRCHFQKADLSACIFRDCVFENCDFVIPNIVNVVLNNTRFKCCKLMGLNFSECCNHGFYPIFDDCLINSCAFEGNNMKHVAFFECKIRDTDFSYCDMTDSKFDRTEFENTSFHDNQLLKADFTDAYGYTIDPFANKIKGAKFSLPAAQSFLSYLGITIE